MANTNTNTKTQATKATFTKIEGGHFSARTSSDRAKTLRILHVNLYQVDGVDHAGNPYSIDKMTIGRSYSVKKDEWKNADGNFLTLNELVALQTMLDEKVIPFLKARNEAKGSEKAKAAAKEVAGEKASK